MNKKAFYVLSFICLTACSTTGNNGYLHTNKNAYLQSSSVPPVSLPSGLSGNKIDNYYAIPSVPGDTSTPISLLPPGSLAAQKASQ